MTETQRGRVEEAVRTLAAATKAPAPGASVMVKIKGDGNVVSLGNVRLEAPASQRPKAGRR